MFSNNFIGVVSLLTVSLITHHRFVLSQLNPYVSDVWDTGFSTNFINVGENITQNCSKSLAVFTEAVTNLTRCTILNSRPIRICTNCEDQIDITKEAYNELRSDSSDCRKMFFESDEVGIINLVFNQGKDLWTQGNCQNCYNNVDLTKKFFKVSEDLDNCLKRFNESLPKLFNDTCNACEEFFIKMNDFYKEFVQGIGGDDSGGVCIDIIDQMNITRQTWRKMHCVKFDSNIGYPNIITAVIVGCIPVFFYMLAKNIAIIEDIKLVRPKRKSFASLHSESLTLPEAKRVSLPAFDR